MNLFEQSNSWADRKLVAIQAAGQSKTKPYVFLTSCVAARGEDIDAMTENKTEITYRTMQKYCDLSVFAKELGYDKRKDVGLTLKGDWHVSYWKSFYRGCPCYYIDHSGIEYIYIEADKWGPLSMNRTLRFISDPGHGWLEVPRTELDLLRISDQISAFSYEEGDMVYLEEDLDAGIYVKALAASGYPKPQLREIHEDSTAIRGYAPYREAP